VYILDFGTIVIPLNWFGIKQLAKLQKWSLPIVFVFLGAAIIMSLFVTPDFNGNFLTYLPEGVDVGRTALLLCIGMHHGIMGLTELITSAVLRFIITKDIK